MFWVDEHILNIKLVKTEENICSDSFTSYPERQSGFSSCHITINRSCVAFRFIRFENDADVCMGVWPNITLLNKERAVLSVCQVPFNDKVANLFNNNWKRFLYHFKDFTRISNDFITIFKRFSQREDTGFGKSFEIIFVNENDLSWKMTWLYVQKLYQQKSESFQSHHQLQNSETNLSSFFNNHIGL